MVENLQSDDLIGRLIGTKYYVEKLLGKGSMGRVYLVKNMKLCNKWAMKVVRKKDKNSKFFKREAEILEKINHPNMPHIIDMFDDEENIYIVETYIQGILLSEKMEYESKLCEEEVIDYIYQLAGILEYLHSMKPNPIVYRDLKPNNIIITYNNRLVLVDFSISKEQTEDDFMKTMIAGNRNYSSPEQMDFDLISDTRSDIFSLGMLALRMLIGRLCGDVVNNLNEYPEISSGLKEIIERCTYKDKELRYQSMSDLVLDLKYLNEKNYVLSKGGKKIILVDGATNIGKSFITSEIAKRYADSKIVTSIIDLSLSIGISEYLNISQESNILEALETTNKVELKRTAYKVEKYINVYKGEILDEDKLIDFLRRVIKISDLIFIDGLKKQDTKIYKYVDEIILVTTQEEKSQGQINKKIVEYLDNSVELRDVSMIVNKYEKTDSSQMEMLRNVNLIPKIFKSEDKVRRIYTLRNIDRVNFLRKVKDKKSLYEVDETFKSEIDEINKDIYNPNFTISDIKREYNVANLG